MSVSLWTKFPNFSVFSVWRPESTSSNMIERNSSGAQIVARCLHVLGNVRLESGLAHDESLTVVERVKGRPREGDAPDIQCQE